MKATGKPIVVAPPGFKVPPQYDVQYAMRFGPGCVTKCRKCGHKGPGQLVVIEPSGDSYSCCPECL